MRCSQPRLVHKRPNGSADDPMKGRPSFGLPKFFYMVLIETPIATRST